MFELASIYLLNHRSATYARISRQYDEALKIRPASAGEPPNVLNGRQLAAAARSAGEPAAGDDLLQHANLPYFPGSDGYYDWLYALHGLFLRGASRRL